MIILGKLTEKQRNHRAEKIKKIILKQTHDIKLVKLLSPITIKLDGVKKSTQELGDVIKKSQTKTPQLAIENVPTTHQPIENTPTTHQPMEKNEGIIYDVEIENTLNKMTDITGFFKTYHDPQRGWLINNHPIKKLRGTKVEIKENKSNMSRRIRKVLVDQSYETAKAMTVKDKLIFRKILQKTGYYNRKPTKGHLTGRDRYIKYDLDNDVSRILKLDINLRVGGLKKFLYHLT